MNSFHGEENFDHLPAPEVSVLMSVYNGIPYLKQAIQSILDQTFYDFEFIIINDGSTDRTQEVLETFLDPRIRLVTQPNTGLTRALNQGLRLCRGRFMARIDADDLSMPERLEQQLLFLKEHPEIGMVGTAYFEIDDEGKILCENFCPIDDGQLKKNLIKHNPFCHTSIMIRKSVLNKIGFYDESFLYGQDYELYFRIARHYKLANLPYFLTKRRIRDGNISFSHESQQLKYGVAARIKAIQAKQYPFHAYFYLLWPLIVLNVPITIKTWIRKNIRKKLFA